MLPVTIGSINQAFKEIKHLGCTDWEGDYRAAARQALKEILESKMHNAVDVYLQQIQANGLTDRRNGYYPRHLLSELGDLELSIPRTRTFSPASVLKRFARRLFPVERLIMLAFVLGLSTRKVGQALLPILGEAVSPATVSRIAQQLDAAVQAYHRRRLTDHYQVLLLDGLVIKRKNAPCWWPWAFAQMAKRRLSTSDKFPPKSNPTGKASWMPYTAAALKGKASN